MSTTDSTPEVRHTYEVFVARNGYCEVKASSPEDAMRIVDESFKTDEVSWDDDWHPTDVQRAS